MEFRIENSSSQVKDFQIEGSWIPATPAKPVLAEPHPICRDKGENQSWQANSKELKSVLQENSQVQASRLCQNSSACCVGTNSVSISEGLDSRGENLVGKSQCDNNNITMYKNFSMDNFNKWDMPFQDLLAFVDAGAVSKSENGRSSSFLSVPNALTEGKQVVKCPINLQPAMHQIAPGSEFQMSSNSIPDTQQCRQHIPSHYFFDLNSTPAAQSEADIISISLPSQFAPVTPDQTRKTENRQICDLWNSSMDERINDANHKQGIGSAKRTSLEEQTQLHQGQSCGAVSTQPQVDLSPDKGANESSILNRTPTQKPRRRKHRPKVVIEGQPKRTRKPRTPKSDTPTETPTSKRKYVRRKRVEKPTDTPEAEASETADSKTVRQTRKSCRRSLNFDAAIHMNEERSSCTHEQTVVTGVQSTVQLQYGLESTFEKTEVGIAYELTQSTNQVLEQYLSHPERQAPILSTPKNIDQPHTKSVNDAQTAYRRGKCRIHFSDETHDKEASTVDSPNDSICSTSACMNKGKPGRGTKREHSEKIGGIEMCTFNSMGAQYNSCQVYQPMRPDYGSGSFPEMHFPLIFKKKRTEKGQQLSTSTPLSSDAAAEGFVRDMASDPFSLDSARRFSDAQLNASNGPGITAVGTTQEEQHYFNCVLAFDHMKKFKKKRTKGLTRVRDLASFAGNIGSNQWPTPASEVASGVMQEFDASHQPPTCVEALAAHVVKLTTRKRTKRNSTSTLMSSNQYYHQQSPSDHLAYNVGVYPHLIWKNMNPVDALVEQFELLHINRRHSDVANQEYHALVPYYTRYQEKNAVVLYQRGGTLVPFEDSFNPIKRRKPRPKVDLDDETTRVWKLLLEDINSQGIDGTDEDKAKWWEEERKVFRGRADSFIARMHLVQGDRRFSRWKGSVLDSVIGVFLTQNVSDHLSSSAFMSLAARYPLKSERDHGSTSGEKTSVSVREPEITEPDPDQAIRWHEGKLSEPANDQSSMTLQDVGYCEEKEVVNSNEFSGSSSIGIRPKDKSDCEVIEICGSNLTVCHESALSRSDNHISERVTKFMGDHREMDDVVSSQTSVVSSQNSMDSSFPKSEERIESCSQSNSRREQIAGCEPSVPDSSLIELLQIQRMATLHGVYSEEKADGSSNKIGQENLVDKAYSEEQNQAISTSCQAIPSSNILHLSNSGGPNVECFEILGKENRMSDVHKSYEEKCASDQSGLSSESASQVTVQMIRTSSKGETRSCNNLNDVVPEVYNSQLIAQSPESNMDQKTQKDKCEMQQVFDAPNFSEEISDVTESTTFMDNSRKTVHKAAESNLNDRDSLQTQVDGVNEGSSKVKRVRAGKAKQNAVEWDSLRQQTKINGKVRGKECNTMDSLDYEAVRCADVDEIADTIKERGMNNMLAERIKDFLNRLVREHGSIDLEWLRDVPPDKAKEYLLSVRGLGLKSVECVRLLTLHHLAFPVDTNVGRIAVRLGWVPLQPLPESLQLHLLEMYPVLETIQKYLWPRLCKLDQRTLYELHYQMITFGKVFCTKSKPNCNACPMRGECRHFASAFASARLALPAPAEKSIVSATENKATHESPIGIINGQPLPLPLPPPSCQMDEQPAAINIEPVIEEPATPGPIIEVPTTPEQEQIQYQEIDIEDGFGEDPDEIPTIKLNIEEFTQNLQNYMEKNMDLQDGDMSRALVALTPEVASIPTPKLKNVSRLRTEHQVYELPDSHPLLEGLDKREPDDPSSYLLAIWTPGETAESIKPPEGQCSTQELGRLCDEQTCFSCNSLREANTQTVRGTLLIPCRTAMRGSFPLNGTYFQVNEVFADHDSSLNPIDVPRSWIWNLPRRTVFFGTSIPTIFKGLTTEGIQYCFWRGFVCVRGFDQTTRAPRPLMARLHFPASKLTRTRGRADES